MKVPAAAPVPVPKLKFVKVANARTPAAVMSGEPVTGPVVLLLRMTRVNVSVVALFESCTTTRSWWRPVAPAI